MLDATEASPRAVNAPDRKHSHVIVFVIAIVNVFEHFKEYLHTHTHIYIYIIQLVRVDTYTSTPS